MASQQYYMQVLDNVLYIDTGSKIDLIALQRLISKIIECTRYRGEEDKKRTWDYIKGLRGAILPEWVDTFEKIREEVKKEEDPEYKEYQRLKNKFENPNWPADGSGIFDGNFIHITGTVSQVYLTEKDFMADPSDPANQRRLQFDANNIIQQSSNLTIPDRF